MVQKRQFHKSMTLQERFHASIPGGSHTYAKGDDQFPEFLMPYIAKGKGCRVWDVDDNEFIEYGMGLRAVSLGHGYEPIVEAAYQQMKLGSNYSRPARIELDAAETFLRLVPGADMVKFAKNGSDCTTAAIKLARAVTGRDMIAICNDHPFFSVDDWFIGTTSINAGIPKTIQDQTLKFRYNDIESVRELFEKYPNRIACFIMEPEKYEPLDLEFVKEFQALCKKNGSLFILDEMITGFRWHIGGAQTLYNIQPDLSTFGKAMGNGFAVAALAGKKEYMELGGLYHDKERVFLLSTTHGAENHALAAAITVMKIYREENVVEHLQFQGERLRNGLLQSIRENNLIGNVGIHGHPSCLVFSTNDQDKNPSQSFRTLFMQECLKQGLLAPNLVISFSHNEKDIDQTIDIINHALKVYRKGLDEGVDKYLEGRPVQPVYRKWNNENRNKT
jgi:glutamate-1-semialdehyde 2,1-aminomutase